MRIWSSWTALASVALFNAGQALAETVPCTPMKRGTGEPCLRQLPYEDNDAGYCAVVENVCDEVFEVVIPGSKESSYGVHAGRNRVSKYCLNHDPGPPTTLMKLDQSACNAWDRKNKPAQMFKTPKPEEKKPTKTKNGFEEIIPEENPKSKPGFKEIIPEENPKPKPGFKVIDGSGHIPSLATPGAQKVANANSCIKIISEKLNHTILNTCNYSISSFYCFEGPTKRDANCAEKADWVAMEIDPNGHTWVGGYETVNGRSYSKGRIWVGACQTPNDRSKWAGVEYNLEGMICGFTDPEGGDAKFVARYEKKLSEDVARGEIDQAANEAVRAATRAAAQRRAQQERDRENDNENAARAIELFGQALGAYARSRSGGGGGGGYVPERPCVYAKCSWQR